MAICNLFLLLQGNNWLGSEGKLNEEGYEVLTELLTKYRDSDSALYAEHLKRIEWEEGKLIERCTVGSYRHAVTIVCSSRGRNKGKFVNGEFPYFAYMELLQPNGAWLKEGNNIVPILPDGRFLMVVERRSVLERYEHPCIVELDDRAVDIGPAGALEFPGGAYDPGESFTMGCLRELQEETNVGDQSARLVSRVPWIYPFSADLALRMRFSVVYLSGLSYADKVENDGGLRILALNEGEVWRNIRNGIITAGQSALLGWGFYQEVKRARQDNTLNNLVDAGYVALDEVQIVKPK